MPTHSHSKISVVGLGYVGLPLVHAFSEKNKVIGFDIAQWHIDELQEFGTDINVYHTWADPEKVKQGYRLSLTDNSQLIIKNYDLAILAVAHNAFKTLHLHNNDKQVLCDVKSFIKGDAYGRLR